MDKKYTVIEAVGDRVVIGIDGKVTAAVNAKYLLSHEKTLSYVYYTKKAPQMQELFS